MSALPAVPFPTPPDHFLDPVNGRERPTAEPTSTEALEAMLEVCRVGGPAWASAPLGQRLALVERLATTLRFRRETMVHAITRSIGKPLRESEREVDKCLHLAEHYLATAEEHLAGASREVASGRRYLRPTPLGTILTISPSNFPLWQVVRSSLPAIIAGNTVLNKPSPHGAEVAELFAEMFALAQFPPCVFQVCHLEPAAIFELIQHPVVRGVAFTGGREAGRTVGAAAGRAIKPAILELGGNDPAVILEDADVESALHLCIQSRLYNNGQTCLGPKRLIVTRNHYHKALHQARVLASAYPHGDPMMPDTPRGPLSSFLARSRLHRQVLTALEEGATLQVGGRLPEGKGAYYPATVISDVATTSIIYREELFGPVIAITPVSTEAEAIAAANATSYGLAASVFTARSETAQRVSEQLEAANVGWNMIARSSPELPFGGIKDSGFGRELGEAGLLNFTYPKTYAGFPPGFAQGPR